MPPSRKKYEVEFVKPYEIRSIFNTNKFYEKTQSGELTAKVRKESHPNPTPKGEPHCTWSQFLYYYDDKGDVIAMVHQYKRPDGSIGASGKPDPKRLFMGERVIGVRS